MMVINGHHLLTITVILPSEFYKYTLLYPVFCLTNALLINVLSDFCLPVFIPPLCLLICGMLFTFACVKIE